MERKKGIRIEVERNATGQVRIKDVSALGYRELPELYFESFPYVAYTTSGLHGHQLNLRLDAARLSHIYPGLILSWEGFRSLMKTLMECGNRLQNIHEEAKIAFTTSELYVI